MGDQVLELELEDWQKMESRVSRMEDVREALERAVEVCEERLDKMGEGDISNLARGAVENHDRLDHLDNVTFRLITGEIGRMKKRISALENKVVALMNERKKRQNV